MGQSRYGLGRQRWRPRRIPPSISQSPTITAPALSRAAMIVGTPAYMAPEVVLAGLEDMRADIFSLGVVFYEMLTGHNPFVAGNVMATLDRVLHQVPEPLQRLNPHVTVQFSRLVHRMIEELAASAELAEVRRGLTLVKTGFPTAGASASPCASGWRSWLWSSLRCSCR